MRTFITSLFCCVFLAICAYVGLSKPDSGGHVYIYLQNADTGKPMSGIVRVASELKEKGLLALNLYNRLKGLKSRPSWYVVPKKGGRILVHKGGYHIEAISGLETALTKSRFFVDGNRKVTLKLRPIFDLKKRHLVAGNTHLHLRNMTLKQSDEYLRQIPPADGLDVLFISYLERHKDDESYITNKYPIGDLKQFDVTGVLVNNGEEHRHNFKGFGQGYGHVMLLDIKRLVQPVSIGPGIMAKGFDDMPLRPGIDDARKQGGTIIWCHNTFGFEDVLNALSGRLDALNVFDGSRRDKFADSWYHYLNVGKRIPISTGTDWFMYDFSRVYAEVPGKLSIKSWLNAVKKGRCQATNGPLLSLRIDGRKLGDVVKLAKPKALEIEANGIGRHKFRLQLVHNGRVISHADVKERNGHFRADLKRSVRVEEPGWFAARIESTAKNELGKTLYAHTSPVYVTVGGKNRFDVDSARELIRQMEEAKAGIRAQGKFRNAKKLERVLQIYDAGIAQLTRRINN